MRGAAHVVLASSLAILSGCAQADEVPVEEPMAEELAMEAVEDSVMLAEDMFDPAAFDSISWESEEVALERGRVVFQFSCQKCHGRTGAGDGGFVADGDTLRPPSFVTAEWRFAEDREGLRRQVFTGTNAGMPHWGFYGLKFRDIDAVATYIQEVLRNQ